MKRHNVKRARMSGRTEFTSSLPWRFFALTILCASILAAGFFFAARQHFMVMDLGLKNSKLRKQIEDLEFERRRLILAKEISISPLEITRAAGVMGFRKNSDAPQFSTITRQGPELTKKSSTFELTTLRLPKRPDTGEAGKFKGKLVRPIVQQTVVESAGLNERPRIVRNIEKRGSTLSVSTISKFR